jgi:hypothetical protein
MYWQSDWRVLVSKYGIAKQAIETAVRSGNEQGILPIETLTALLVSTVQSLRETAGVRETTATLHYELENLGGNVDTVFIRAR